MFWQPSRPTLILGPDRLSTGVQRQVAWTKMSSKASSGRRPRSLLLNSEANLLQINRINAIRNDLVGTFAPQSSIANPSDMNSPHTPWVGRGRGGPLGGPEGGPLGGPEGGRSEAEGGPLGGPEGEPLGGPEGGPSEDHWGAEGGPLGGPEGGPWGAGRWTARRTGGGPLGGPEEGHGRTARRTTGWTEGGPFEGGAVRRVSAKPGSGRRFNRREGLWLGFGL